jgi:hypothetical protein
MELIRRLAVALEDSPAYASFDGKLEGYDPYDVGYHAHLMIQAGLAEGADITSLGSPHRMALLTGLTWQGHEFLDAARDEARWKKAMVLVQQKGGAVTIAVLTEVLKSLMRGQLGLP